MRRLLFLIIFALAAAGLLTWLWRRWAKAGPARRRGITNRPPVTLWLLFLLPLPVAAAAAISLARGQLVALLGNALGYGLLLGGTLLLWRGLAITGGAGRWPRKTLGSALIGLGTGITAWLGVGHGPAIAAAFALVATLGCALTFGIDLGRRRAVGAGIGDQARAALDRAGRAIVAIDQAARVIRQPELNARLRRIAESAREVLQQIEDDPRDLRRARKFLNVYLDGVQRVVEGYAKTHGQVDAPRLDERFRQALITVEDAFQAQRQTLLQRDIEDLDVQIEVLTRQLEREGIL